MCGDGRFPIICRCFCSCFQLPAGVSYEMVFMRLIPSKSGGKMRSPESPTILLVQHQKESITKMAEERFGNSSVLHSRPDYRKSRESVEALHKHPEFISTTRHRVLQIVRSQEQNLPSDRSSRYLHLCIFLECGSP